MLKTTLITLTATLVLASASVGRAQTAQTPPTPQAQPVSPTYPTPAPVIVDQAITAPPTVPPVLTDSDLETASMMLARIETLAMTALHETTKTSELDSARAIPSDGKSGQVTVDRAMLDEIQSLASQVAAMMPSKRQP